MRRPDARERFERLGDARERNVEMKADGRRRERVQDVVPAGERRADGPERFPANDDVEPRRRSRSRLTTFLHGLDVVILRKAVGGDAAVEPLADPPDARVFAADEGLSIERNVRGEIDERVLELCFIVP